MKPPGLRIYFLLSAFIGAILLGGCQPQNVSETKSAAAPDHSILRVGITANAPPFVFKQGGTVTGLEPALASLLGTYLDKKIEFVEVPWEKQLEYLNGGKTDIVMSGMSITKPRSYIVNFTKPYLRSGQIMLVRLEDQQRFATGIDTLFNTNFPIGTVGDTVSDFFVSATINGANEVVFKHPQDAVDALIKKEIDVFIYDAPIVCYFAARHQQDMLVPILSMATEEYIGWAIRKNDTALLSRINEFIDTINSQGDLKREIDYWIPYLNR